MHQRSNNTSIFRHVVITCFSGRSSMAMRLIRCEMQSGNDGPVIEAAAHEARPPASQGQLKIPVSQNFSASLALFSKFGLLAYRLASPPPVTKLSVKHNWQEITWTHDGVQAIGTFDDNIFEYTVEKFCRALKSSQNYRVLICI